MEGVAVEYLPNSIDLGSNEKHWILFIHKWRKWTKCMWFTCSYVSSISYYFQNLILAYDMSTVWGDTNGCAKQYRCALVIYLMTLLSSSYGIIMDNAINTSGYGKNVVDGINEMSK